MSTYFLTKHKFNKKEFKQLEIKVNTISINEILNRLNDTNDIIDFDTETTGLNPHKDKIILIQFGTKTDEYIIDVRDFDIKQFKNLFENKNIMFRGHNLVFDYNMLKQYNILMKNGYCTMIAEMVLYCGKYDKSYIMANSRYSMRGTYFYYFKDNLNKEQQITFTYLGNMSCSANQVKYAAKDVITTRKIYNKQIKLINKWNLSRCIELEMKVLFPLGDISYNGILLDKKKWREIANKNKEKLIEIENKLDKELLKQKHPQVKKYKLSGWTPNLFDSSWKPRMCTVNWGSSKQVLDILSTIFNCNPVTDEGVPSSSEKILDRLKNKPKIVKLLLKYREITKAINTYGENFIKNFVQDDNRVHTTFTQVLDTGRVSSRNPNLQNIKKESEYRSCFIAPKGYKLIDADFSSQEPRTTAHYANDPKLIEFFESGHGDIHSFVTSMLYSKLEGKKIEIPPKIDGNEKALKKHYAHPYAKYRYIGKQLGLKLDYGGTAYTLQFLLNCDKEEAQKFIDLYFEAFPGKKAFFEKSIKFGLKHGYILIDPITKRRSWLKEYDEWKKLSNSKEKLTHDNFKRKLKLQGAMERKCMNYPIQGTCGSMTKLALIYVKRIIENENYNAKLVNVVHDEIVVEVEETQAEKLAKKIEQAMIKAGEKFCKNVKMVAVPKISSHWEH